MQGADVIVLRIECGSCARTVEVPRGLLGRILQLRAFQCPSCSGWQQLGLDEQTLRHLRAQQLVGHAESRQPGAQHSGSGGDGLGLGATQRGAGPDGLADYSRCGSGLLPDPRQLLSRNGSYEHAGQGSLYGANGAGTNGYSYEELLRQRPSASTRDAAPGAYSKRKLEETNASLRQSFARSSGLGSGRGRRPLGGDAHLQELLRRNWAEAAEAGDGRGGRSREAAGDEEGVELEETPDAANTFMEYRPSKLALGKAHPDPVVETASLAAVEPPDISYQLHLEDLIEQGALSALQLESIVYACQRHERLLPDGQRAGFFIGDGAGVGKGRTIAGLIMENWRCGRKRHLWVSIASDLRFDSRRDLDDIGATDIAIQPLNKLPYGRIDASKAKFGDGVIFLTYSSLISSSDKGYTRLDQLVEWCGPDFDGLIVFDECHKAKNLVPDGGGKATKVGEKVLELQRLLPAGRVVYCSATGASEPRNMGYMERLGLWGAGNPAFANFTSFMDAVGSRGVCALELVAMDMKAQGMYVARTLSYAGAEFAVIEEALPADVGDQYKQAADMWNQLRREFLYAAEKLEAEGLSRPRAHMLWRAFWASHQRFFRHMCMAAKVPGLVRLAKEALAEGKCVVIGLQSTGEARTADVIAERGEELDDFVSGPKELLLKLVEDYYPLPTDPDAAPESAQKGPKPKRSGGDAGRQAERGGARAPSATQQQQQQQQQQPLSPVAGGYRPPDESELQRRQSQLAYAPPPLYREHTLQSVEEEFEALRREEDARLQEAAKAEARERLALAMARKEQVKAAVGAMLLPNNPLDQLIDMLGGPDQIAEMTGRKGRLVRQRVGPGVKWEARNASGMAAAATLENINVHERELFLAGRKLIAVISEAASAGISLHADRRAVNQRRRVHLTLELPWSADKAIQQFGRSHRANQAHAPQYRLLFTPLGGERRFAAAVARRLESLGALTQGDRKAGPSLSEFNYESLWGQGALKRTYRAIMEEEPALVTPPACRADAGGHPAMDVRTFWGIARAHLLNVGIIRPGPTVTALEINMYLSSPTGAPVTVGKISDPDKSDVARFLNRLLGLEPRAQAQVFAFYQAVLEATVENAKRDGKYDDGIVDVSGTCVTLAEPPRTVLTDGASGAKTLLYHIHVDRGISWDMATAMLADDQLPPPTSAPQDEKDAPGLLAAASISGSSAPSLSGFYRARKEGPGGKVHSMLALQVGRQLQQQAPTFRICRAATGRAVKQLSLHELQARYVQLSTSEARVQWELGYAEAPVLRKGGVSAGGRWRRVHLLTGLVLPVWEAVQDTLADLERAADRRLKVLRLQTTGDDSKRLVGMQIPEIAVEAVLDKLEMQSGYKHVRQRAGPSNGEQTNQLQTPTPQFNGSLQYPNSWLQGDSALAPIELD